MAESYSWTGQLREWVNASPCHYAATTEEEAAHLERWKAHWLAEEGADGERQMRYEKMMRRNEEALRLEEEEERARLAAMPPSQQTLEEAALAVYQAAFGWAGPPPVFIDLTGGDDGKGKGKAVY